MKGLTPLGLSDRSKKISIHRPAQQRERKSLFMRLDGQVPDVDVIAQLELSAEQLEHMIRSVITQHLVLSGVSVQDLDFYITQFNGDPQLPALTAIVFKFPVAEELPF